MAVIVTKPASGGSVYRNDARSAWPPHRRIRRRPAGDGADVIVVLAGPHERHDAAPETSAIHQLCPSRST